VAQIAEAMNWAPHTVRGFFAGLKKKGMNLEVLERVRQVGPNKVGAKGSYSVYRLAAEAEGQDGGPNYSSRSRHIRIRSSAIKRQAEASARPTPAGQHSEVVGGPRADGDGHTRLTPQNNTSWHRTKSVKSLRTALG
jgi:Protein of unknown function (DUF3489)